VILSSSTTFLPVGIPESWSSIAHLLGTHSPGLTKLLWILQQPAASRSEVVLNLGIEVTAETAQTTHVRRRCGHFEKADTVPEDLDPDLRIDDHAVVCTDDVQSVSNGVRNVDPLPVHLHSHFLAKVHFQVTDL